MSVTVNVSCSFKARAKPYKLLRLVSVSEQKGKPSRLSSHFKVDEMRVTNGPYAVGNM
jgi:hypothetical protein